MTAVKNDLIGERNDSIFGFGSLICVGSESAGKRGDLTARRDNLAVELGEWFAEFDVVSEPRYELTDRNNDTFARANEATDRTEEMSGRTGKANDRTSEANDRTSEANGGWSFPGRSLRRRNPVFRSQNRLSIRLRRPAFRRIEI